MAKRALPEEGLTEADASLLVSSVPDRKIVRLAFDAPFTYGRKGARWYASHHAMAKLLSSELHVPVHAYVLDAEEMEEVFTYGNGRKVGGERLVYDEAELPEDVETEEDFRRLKERWPLGHLAYVYGVRRDDLVKLPRSAVSALLSLTGPLPERRLTDPLLPIPFGLVAGT